MLTHAPAGCGACGSCSGGQARHPRWRQSPCEPRRALDDEEFGTAQTTLDKIVSTARQASVLSPPMLLIASRTFWPSARTPMTTSSEIEVALRSSRTRTTVR
jgi:hypothetical protein